MSEHGEGGRKSFNIVDSEDRTLRSSPEGKPGVQPGETKGNHCTNQEPIHLLAFMRWTSSFSFSKFVYFVCVYLIFFHVYVSFDQTFRVLSILLVFTRTCFWICSPLYGVSLLVFVAFFPLMIVIWIFLFFSCILFTIKFFLLFRLFSFFGWFIQVFLTYSACDPLISIHL